MRQPREGVMPSSRHVPDPREFPQGPGRPMGNKLWRFQRESRLGGRRGRWSGKRWQDGGYSTRLSPRFMTPLRKYVDRPSGRIFLSYAIPPLILREPQHERPHHPQNRLFKSLFVGDAGLGESSHIGQARCGGFYQAHSQDRPGSLAESHVQVEQGV